MLTVLLIINENRVSGAVVLFSVLHELGHILALLSLKIQPKSISVNVFGMNIELGGNLSTAEKCFVFAAGFSVNLILSALFFIGGNPLFGYINLIIGIFTALPLPSADGGSILKTVLDEYIPRKAETVFKSIAIVFATVISILIIAVFIFTGNYFVFIALFYMFLCIKKLPPS